ncbi:MAG: hypothetical protein K2F87_03400 [Muribaculaceae bacterium]|nr:hypothetical protein [Muribaculaceae bacterium]
MRFRSLLIPLLSIALLVPFYAGAQSRSVSPSASREVVTEKVVVTRFLSDGSVRTDTIDSPEEIIVQRHGAPELMSRRGAAQALPEVKPKQMLRNLMLGLELSTGLDLSGTDMSTFNADLIAGYRNNVIQLLGISAGVHKSLGTRDTFIPLQAVFRTGFRSSPTLCFMHLSIGYSFNTIAQARMFGDFMATVGPGINLVQKPKFQSNIVLAFGFRHLNQRHQEMTNIAKPNLGFAQISFGISM